MGPHSCFESNPCKRTRKSSGSSYFNRGHNIYEKDFFRLLKSETNVNKHLKRLKAKEAGGSINFAESTGGKGRQPRASDRLSCASLPANRIHTIDKIVRMRCSLLGAFGVDHSEVLNYE